MSMVSNLRELEENGMEAFLKIQEAKYKCPECSDVISVHDRKCYACGVVNSGLKKRREV
jgi:Zn finger protein HypA/HybF involved in hydrogenase expression